jgi:hypothetical protein
VGIVSRSTGGGAAGVTAKVRLAATAVGRSAGAQVLFDTIVYDSAGYFDAANHQLKVPSGKAGKHLFAFFFEAANVPVGADPVVGVLTWSGAEANVAGTSKRRASVTSADQTVTSLVNANVGDAMQALLDWDGGGTLDYLGGASGCYLGVVFLG